MIGHAPQALEFLDHARNCYHKANDQKWGQIHTDITEFLIRGDPAALLCARAQAVILGYRRDLRYIGTLLAGGSVEATAHQGHFLLFP
jgi:hypothetical protein